MVKLIICFILVFIVTFYSNSFASNRIVGIADIIPKIGELHRGTAMCCVRPKKYKSIEARKSGVGSRIKAFTIDYDNLPDMITFGYQHDYAKVYSHSGRSGNITIKKNGELGTIGPRDYRQYHSYPELLEMGLIKNNSVKSLYSFTGSVFNISKKISKDVSFEYKGYINQNGSKWIYVDVYDKDSCSDNKRKQIGSGWVKAYTNDQPSLWVFPRGC